MVRKLKYHEQKLLKKLDFISWKVDNNLHEVKILRKFHIQRRDDYTAYYNLVKEISQVVAKIKDLAPDDPLRASSTERLLEKLYSMGLIKSKTDLSAVDTLTASSFCRRRLAVMLRKMKMAETVKDAVKFIEQGHIRVGPELVKDPAMLITRNLEDFITWVDSSAIRKKVLDYNGMRDDFEL